MSSKARNFRRRGGDDADDDEDNDKNTKTPTTNGSTTTTSSKPQFKSISNATRPKKLVSPVPKSRLSFADNEEADADQLPIKPRPSSSSSRLSRLSSSSSSSSSHKLNSSKDRIGPQTTASLPSNVQPQAGTYTKEALLELQKNTRILTSSRSGRPEPPKSKPEMTPTEPVIVLKGLVKPKPNMVDDTDGEIENDEMGVEQKGDLVRTERDEAKFRLGLRGKSEASGGVIPNQATIDAIREA